MKKIAFMLFAALLSLQVIGQSPIMDRKSEGYTIAEIKKLALGDSVKAKEFRKNLLELVQVGLNRSGENVVITNDSISWVIEHLDSIAVEIIVPKGSINSGWSEKNKVIYFFPMEENWEGDVYVFKFGKCNLPLMKANCCNLLSVIKRVNVATTPSSNSTPNTGTNPSPTQGQSLSGIPPINVNVTNTNTNDFGPLIEALGKLNQPPAQPAVDLKLPATVVEKKSLNPWVPIIIGGVITLGTGAGLYFLLRDKGGPVGAPGHGDGGPVGAPGHGDGIGFSFDL
ncbi:MAG: hypothetical protein WC908_02480 [Candidatus Paceibacterota bacterium]